MKPYVDFTPSAKFEAFLTEAATLLSVDVAALKDDENWYWCFDDGMTAAEAVAEYRKAMAT